MEPAVEYSFRGQRQDEKILLVVKQHVWLFCKVLSMWVVLAFLAMLSLKYFGASAISSFVLAVTVLLGLAVTARRWFLWSNGVYIITNQRVIKTDQVGLFRRLISEAELDRIQEITTEIGGPIRTLLNFGTVHIQTASRSGRIDLENVPSPYDIQQMIVRARQQAVATREGSLVSAVEPDVVSEDQAEN